MSRLLLCTDLDRTLLPNGTQPESVQARKKFSQLVNHTQVTLVYVSGRHQQLVQQAIEEFQLPQADFVIADVGSSIYEINNQHWHQQQQWNELIDSDWHHKNATEIHGLLHNIEALTLQEASKQNLHKLSYYLPLDIDSQKIVSKIQQTLQSHSIAANIIFSVDSQANTGLVDILPASAGKLQAIQFLMKYLDFTISNTVFAGDSGNDLCVLSSPIHSILVANADENVRNEAIKQAQAHQHSDALYLAQGNFMGMNGNYSGGILEGVVHYFPQAENWLRGEA